MASSYSSEPLTLHVNDLAQATSFYLSVLSPLGYAFISKTQHQTAAASSEAVGVGPAGTSRIDIFLSQSSKVGASKATGAHVVFPAKTTFEVRQFYAAAVQAGGKPIAPPDNLATSDGMFASIIKDHDGNQVEVCCAEAPTNEEPEPVTPETSSSIQKWRNGVAESAVPESVSSSTAPKAAPTAAPSQPLKSAISKARSLASSEPVRVAMSAAAGASSQASLKRSASRSAASARSGSVVHTPAVNVGNKTVVGTLIGAGVGAALAYTTLRSKKDSDEQRDDHERRLRSIDAKAEARAHCDTADRKQASGKADAPDRDSGYGSGSQYSASPPLLNRRSVTYPQPGYAPPSSRGRSSTRRYIDYGPRTMSPEHYYQAPPSRKQSVGGSSQTTVKPVQRSQSNASRRSSSHRSSAQSKAPPSEPPGPPSMPSPPSTRSRRSSYSGQAPSVGRQSSLKSKPPSSFPKAMGAESSQLEASNPSRAPSPRHSDRSARNVPLPASEAPSASTIRRSNSHKSSAAERNAPLPASQAPSKSTARPPLSRHSSGTAQNRSSTPSRAPSGLTARALSSYQHEDPRRTGSKLDDMATVVPDDSISCISEREERRERDRRASMRSQRHGSGTSRRSSYHER